MNGSEAEPLSARGEGLLLAMCGAALGALLSVLVIPRLVPALATSLEGPEPRAFWYLARTSGIVSYLLLWSSISLGLLASSRLSRLWPGGSLAVDIHQFTSLLAIAFAFFHALVLLGDRTIGVTGLQIILPFGSTWYRPFWVGLGQVGFYLMIPVAFSFYFRRIIGYRTWRLVHYGGFVVYWLVVLHAAGAGSDVTSPEIVGLYLVTILITYALTVYRILISLPHPQRIRGAQSKIVWQDFVGDPLCAPPQNS
ncbi:MAG: ferric reductase-like transmembrane domain-containing protein [Armatimonadota bacterium]|nr:ferric reductase-like transmembrane domain-containing protein [Armatimonadota bacterium]